MDISSGMQAAALDQYSTRTGDAVTTTMMSKVMDMQAQNGAQLIQGIEESSQAIQEALPDNVGNNVNTVV
ncbi:Putative motility protein [Thiohalospira halophila DSM 15071]|uniref:Putative motility protein n=1 Tax=Thiohalospira halophila DSM 15071 TaxID=1123397 RepID=A0A1I1Q253_9GAMM|nr:putative motility protein [Thiohalospira halophila]SFD16216.1 Putative motility protein [Thiohalospira halophila DSM 15071]